MFFYQTFSTTSPQDSKEARETNDFLMESKDYFKPQPAPNS